MLFDQRGAGRSTPHAGDSVTNRATDLAANTTHHLIADIERLRDHLGIQRWLVWGASWGATLALAYAQRYPQRVSEIMLASVTMTRPAEIQWLYHGVGRFFPEQWARFRAGVPESDRDGDLVAAYYHLLNDPDPGVRHQAARDWLDWEDAVVSLEAGHQRPSRYQDPRVRMAFARIVTHYFHHHAWLADGIRCARPVGSPASPVSWCTVASTSADHPSRPGNSPRPGQTPSCTSSTPAISAVRT